MSKYGGKLHRIYCVPIWGGKVFVYGAFYTGGSAAGGALLSVFSGGTGAPVTVPVAVTNVAVGISAGGAVVALSSLDNFKDDLWKLQESKGESETLPNQGTVQGDVPNTPPVDAGKQGKHVPEHNNNDPSKSQWPEGKTGVNETQRGWQEGTKLPDGTKVWDSGNPIGANGETGVRVHIDGRGNIHGYPVNPEKYLPNY